MVKAASHIALHRKKKKEKKKEEMLHSHLLSEIFVKMNFPKITVLHCHGCKDYTHHSVLAPASSPRPDFFPSVLFRSAEDQIHLCLGHGLHSAKRAILPVGEIQNVALHPFFRASHEPCDGRDITHETQTQFQN